MLVTSGAVRATRETTEHVKHGISHPNRDAAMISSQIGNSKQTVPTQEEMALVNKISLVQHIETSQARDAQSVDYERDTRSVPTRISRGHSKSQRKRGQSLERLISQLVLQTASAGASEAHFVVDTTGPLPDCKSAEFILQDLGQSLRETTSDLLNGDGNRSEAPSEPTIQETASPPVSFDDPNLELNLTITEDEFAEHVQNPSADEEMEEAREEQAQSELMPVEAPVETLEPVDSFDNLSWNNVPTAPKIAKVKTFEDPSGNEAPAVTPKSDPPASQPPQQLQEGTWGNSSTSSPSHVPEQEAVSVEDETTFDAAFEEWTPFETSPFTSKSAPISGPIDENGFFVTSPPQVTPSSETHHPGSPDSVFGFPGESSTSRVDPPQLQTFYRQHQRVTRISI